MKDRHDSTSTYYISIFAKMLKLGPFVGLSAALTFTVTRALGYFAFLSVRMLILFDLSCLTYFGVAHTLKRIGIEKDGIVDERALTRALFIFDAVVLYQWNLISYIIPFRDFWGFAPMFVMLCSLMFRADIVLTEIIGITLSIAASWILNGDALLPVRDEMFIENLVLRGVALATSFTVLYILARYAEKFTALARDNFKSLSEQNENLERLNRDIIDFTADIIEERDSASGAHVKRLKAYTRMLAEQLAADYPEYNLTEDKITRITMACVLHDVGKIAISDSILLKPGRLTAEEFEVIKTHTVLGARIIDKLPPSMDAEYRRICREICLCHHEKYDGRGYPAGLKGDDIPISAQIVSAVDCYDALTSERPYKPALPGEKALKMILDGECGAFGDKLKSCLIKCRDRLI